ncbi:MAG: SIR2 family protein [Cellulomonadaceae bacterium]
MTASPPGHVFVVNGSLAELGADVLVIPTDAHFSVRQAWHSIATGLEPAPAAARIREMKPARWRPGAALPAALPVGEQWIWFVDAARPTSSEVAQVAANVIEGVAHHRADLRAQARKAGRELPLVAMPVLGSAGGGHNTHRGELLRDLLTQLTQAARKHSIDVAIVATSRSDYTALQRRRHDSGVSPDLPDHLTVAARGLAERAGDGELAVFLGAGISMGAGLPSWDGLLDALAEELKSMGTLDGIDPSTLSPLEQAELFQVLLDSRTTDVGQDDDAKSPQTLGTLVSRIIKDKQTKPGLAHTLLAGLRIREAVTTNYDDLYERAFRAAKSDDSTLSVLPWAPAPGDKPWLLKMHGDVGHEGAIVLSRSSFVGYDARWRPLGSMLESMMMTRHVLVVGASMTDDNVLRLAYEVARLREELGVTGEPIGTVLAVSHAPAFARLWEGRFTVLETVPDADRAALPADDEARKTEETTRQLRASRTLAIFLDILAMHATRDAAYLLDERYADDAGAAGRDLIKDARDFAERAHQAGSSWKALAKALDQLGANEGRPDHRDGPP